MTFGKRTGITGETRYLNDHDLGDYDLNFFNAINHGNSFLKKRSATIHVQSTIKDIQEEDDLIN